MVPEVNKPDTEQLIQGIRTTAENIRQEILAWVLPKEQTSNDAEAQAVRKLAARSAQTTRQWTGQMLKELDTTYPYPNSSDGTTQIIDKSAVPEGARLTYPAPGMSLVQQIKHCRGLLTGLKGQLDELLAQCFPGSVFNQCLHKTQEHVTQTGMWLGELLHEFYESQPKAEAEAVAPGNEAAPMPSFWDVKGASETLSPNTSNLESLTSETSTNTLEPVGKTEYPAAEAGVPYLNTEDPKANYTPESKTKKTDKPVRK